MIFKSILFLVLLLKSVYCEELRSRLRKKPSGADGSRSASLSVPFGESWCKRPCWCELVPVSGRDRAHSLHSDAAPRLCPTQPQTGKKAPLPVR